MTPNGSPAACPFCDYAGPSTVLEQWAGIFVVEPMDPVTDGHVLVIPTKHVEHAADDPMEAGRVVTYAAEYVRRKRSWDCMDANIIMSIGPNATQSVRHLHVHVIPRREGDGLALPWTGQVKADA